MTKKILAVLLSCFLFFLLTACSAEKDIYSFKKNNLYISVHDLADVLTDEEEQELISTTYKQAKRKIKRLTSDDGFYITYLTSDNIGMKDVDLRIVKEYSDKYTDDLIDYNGYPESGIIAFIYLGTPDFDYIGTTGRAIKKISDRDVDKIISRSLKLPVQDYQGRLETIVNEALIRY